ncbi:PEPxxWA-CTERM sorting domain-containing protein [Altererythrobacter salegens]|uniref:PEPxxWA-CTERM sorting domain-containing protein n=1 Tax=Croceibacterium salegens TaxID=1737568 RepID=A0A6I4T144_9SPHN|nr:FxDxF family PEP-CTERM protein [Croceibacterium salegens]MXO60382.1 PEPxxWA-CTERM sorting domain-containing protein [Croceibacterium salegens]
MKSLTSIVAISVGLSVPTAANAATVISFNIAPGSQAATFQSGIGPLNLVSCNSGPTGCAGNFTASGTFAMNPGWKLVGATLTTGPATKPSNNINFASATLNGTPFTFFSPNGGISEFGILQPIMMQAVNNLNVSGYTGGRASFAGTLTFAQAVPEPATWVMMIVGFGAIGFATRRRKDTKASGRSQISYA